MTRQRTRELIRNVLFGKRYLIPYGVIGKTEQIPYYHAHFERPPNKKTRKAFIALLEAIGKIPEEKLIKTRSN